MGLVDDIINWFSNLDVKLDTKDPTILYFIFALIFLWAFLQIWFEWRKDNNKFKNFN